MSQNKFINEFWLLLLFIFTIASLFSKFHYLSVTSFLNRSDLYMLDTIKLLAIFNLIFVIILFFKFYNLVFFLICTELSFMLLLSLIVWLPHLIIIYGVLLFGFIKIFKKQVKVTELRTE